VDRFSSAMRVLGRTEHRPVSPEAARRAARKAAARRRRVLAVLLVLTGVVVGVVGAGLAPVWSPAVPAAMLVGFLVIARLQVRRTRTKTWERTLRTAAGSGSAPVGDEPDDAPTVVMDPVVDAQSLRQHVVAAAVVPTSDGSSLWDPLPVTLPTYVSKPRAERSIRTIDLTGPGAWTSGHVPGGTTADEPGDPAAASAGDPAGEAAASPRAVGD
jgi:hypothetical protein